ncbi:DUF1501 domain-containing protein [Chitinophaga sp. GCM10012297]|uniref:DUF1501 domain-containing protein n=1 Tax=Chitinophaga chungangae TaxID=2821488 RepID=A0ABS3YIT8_9BACT|nr:DUF1501 domain-containing protein [Chitinophaga chungangae]MBO9154604.1 DUF1501 domain-containing protein [Chitinophaga chungangae]
MKRRDFLKYTAPAAILPSFINGFAVKAFGASPLLAALESTATDNDHVLVMIQLNGGNDGLNMVIPLDQYDKYQAARTNIAIPTGNVLKLSGQTKTGLHPAMTGLRDMYDEGHVSIVHSVGYPSPNFSHFRATDIWLTGSDANTVLETGWGGRYLDTEYPGYPDAYPNPEMPDPLAIQIGSIVSPAFVGNGGNMGMAVTSATDFYDLIEGREQDVPNTRAGKELKYIRLIQKQTNRFADSIKEAASKVTNQRTYPANNYLGEQLKIVARLVGGGLKTRLYMVSIGGFDTHASQVNSGDTTTGAHANLLKNISEAVRTFTEDLRDMKKSQRVVGMTFSEFGRRIKSNGSMGTDHGASAPMIIFGDYVNQQVLGNTPTMPDAASAIDNIPMQYDFRSVYASLLEQWFCVKPADLNKIMLNNYQSLPLINGLACSVVTGVPNVNDDDVLVTNYPNPFQRKTVISYKSRGGHTMVQVFDTMGRLMATLADRVHVAGNYTIDYETELPAGVYYVRLQNGAVQQVRTMLKVR